MIALYNLGSYWGGGSEIVLAKASDLISQYSYIPSTQHTVFLLAVATPTCQREAIYACLVNFT